MRVFALSDIHADCKENRAWVRSLSMADYREDTLLVAGDISCDLSVLQETLACLKARFRDVFFVPGNHELWIRRDECEDSVKKLFRVLDACRSISVHTQPQKWGFGGQKAVWIVPLFSWYRKPNEGERSLFMTKPGEDPESIVWMDDQLIKWNMAEMKMPVADFFLRMNKEALRSYDAPVISFSHFLPRRELIFGGAVKPDVPTKNPPIDPHPAFNFSRVAGCAGLEGQIRLLGSIIHVYGHQHRNRNRRIDGIRYVSHCLGYPQERASGHLTGTQSAPLLLWTDAGDAAS